MTPLRSRIPVITFTLLILTGLASVPAMADTLNGDGGHAVSSSRTFPAVNTVRTIHLAESAHVDNTDGQWGETEQLDVPKTESTREKQDRIAKEEARKASEKARQASERASMQAQSEVSRSQTREKPVTVTGNPTGEQVAALASRYVGSPYVYGGNTPAGWDCSGFVQYVYSRFGISIPHGSYAQRSVGSPVSSLAEAQPGDIITSGSHSGIYLGNGLVVNALNPRLGTRITGLNVYYGTYSIRRIV